MRRFTLIGSIVVGVAVFLVISALLARALSVGGAEDSAITALVRAEAAGNASAAVAEIAGCARQASCRTRIVEDTAALKRPGNVQIIEINPSAGFSLGSTLGSARVAWLVGGSLPRVQCVRVQRAGSVISGYRVKLLRVSLRIRSNADCPSRY